MAKTADGTYHEITVERSTIISSRSGYKYDTARVEDTVVTCTCGARWTHEPKDSDEEIQSIFESHLRYFNRPKTVVL